MALQDVVKRAAQTAHKIVAKEVVVAEYHSVGTQDYDPDSGDNDEQGGSNYSLTSGLFESLTSKEIEDKNILKDDAKFMFPSLDLPVEPKEDDLLTITATGVVYKVIAWDTDPFSAEYVLQLRKQQGTT